MAWTTPRTWTPGEVVTASIYNEHIRDNLVYLKNAFLTSFEYGVSARVSLASDQSLTNALWTKVLFDTVEHDPDSLWDATNKWYVIPATGVYLISMMGMWASNTTGDRYLLPSENLGSADEWVRRSHDPSYSDSWGRHTGLWNIYATAGDYVAGWTYQDSGGALAFKGTTAYSYANWFGIMRVTG